MRICTVIEASELLRVSPKTLYKWAERKQIPHYRFNGAVRFRTEDLEKWIKDSKVRERA